MDISIETYIVDGFASSAPIDNAYDPEIRASLAANATSMTRPLIWQDSDDNFEWFVCGGAQNVVQNLQPGSEVLPPCIVNVSRINAFHDDPRYGPYFLHVWGWKYPNGRDGPKVGLDKSDPVTVQPWLTIYNALDPLGGDIFVSVPLTPIPQPFSHGANVFALTSKHFKLLNVALGSNPLNIAQGITFDFVVPMSYVYRPLDWHMYDHSYSRYVAQKLPVVDNGDIDRTVACGGVLPSQLNFCLCGSQLKLLPTGCQAVCQCVDPVGYYMYRRGVYLCPFGLKPGECR